MNRIKLTLLLFAFIGIHTNISLAQEADLPQPSPGATIVQNFGLVESTVSYSRPSMKGRKIFGALVPYGEMWRTGANKCVNIKFDKDVNINNQKVPAGTYSLFTIPNQNEWTIVINKNTEHWGTGTYKLEEDLMRFNVKPVTIPATESFTIDFANIKQNSATMQLYWETTKVSFDIVNDYMEEAMANIKTSIEATQNTHGIYNDAAEFYLDNNLDAKQALEWAKKSVEIKERYWNIATYSRALAANGMYKEAVANAEKSLKLAEEAKNMGMVDGIKRNIEDWKKMM
ncbi:MAG: DUF2911 domain-containing protein [Fimbriimonadaceae bacterium]|nr:DUF2911 domain-containing protein [Chitinophagales bacterium]